MAIPFLNATSFSADITVANSATASNFITTTDSGININGITLTRVAANSAIRVSQGLETLGLLRSYAALAVGTTGTFGGNVDVNGTQITVGTNSSIFAENNLKFKSTGAAFIDHNTVAQSIKFRLSSSSSLDVTPLEITASYVAFANVPIVGTMAAGDNSTRAASTAFVTTAVATGVGAYLPLTAGSTKPLTGDLYINKSAPALRLNDSGSNKPYELRVDAETFSIKEVSNSRTLMSITTGAVITLDSLGSNTIINTSGAMVVPNGNVGNKTTTPQIKLEVKSENHS